MKKQDIKGEMRKLQAQYQALAFGQDRHTSDDIDRLADIEREYDSLEKIINGIGIFTVDAYDDMTCDYITVFSGTLEQCREYVADNNDMVITAADGFTTVEW